jgi:hypothetical protein
MAAIKILLKFHLPTAGPRNRDKFHVPTAGLRNRDKFHISGRPSSSKLSLAKQY